MSLSKEQLLQQTCLSLLSKHLSEYFSLLSDLQCTRAGGYLSSVLRPSCEPALDSRAAGKLVEELMHPFKLMADCERKYYEWSFMTAVAAGGDAGAAAGGADAAARGRRSGAAGEDDDGSLKFKYSQIPVALKKTMQVVHKIVVQQAQQQAQQSRIQQQQQQQQLLHSASMSNLSSSSPVSPLSPRGREHSTVGLPMTPGGPTPGGPSDRATETVFTSLLMLMEEVVSSFIPLKLQMIHFYENLQAVSAATSASSLTTAVVSGSGGAGTGGVAPRVRDVHYGELVRALVKLRARCERFAHPHLVRVRDSLLLPELFLLEHCLALEGDDPTRALLPAYDWKHTILTLTRIKAEHHKWLQRILARDKEVNAPGGGASTAGTAGAAGRKGVLPSTALVQAAKYTPLLSVSVSSATVPAALHWLHQLSHSLLCKATLLFWSVTAAKSAEIKGASAAGELAARLERLDVNYVAVFDRMLKRIPHCYSIALMMDCTGASSAAGTGATRVVDPLRPLQLRDAAVSDEELEYARLQAEAQAEADAANGLSPPPPVAQGGGGGGLGQYPVLFSWPPSRAVLEEWNLVALLQQKADLMAELADLANALPPPSTVNTTPAPQPAGLMTPGSPHSPPPTMSPTGTSAASAAANFSMPPSRPVPLSLLAAVNNHPSASQLVALGPSHHPLDLLVWDFENELPIVPRGGGPPQPPPPGAVSYFLARLDVSKNVWLVVTLQQGCSNAAEAPAASAGGAAEASGGADSSDTAVSAPLSASAASTPSHASSASTPSHSSSSAAAASPSVLSGAARRRAFDHLLAETTPVLQRLRHLHVMQHLQPNLGKKRS